MSPLTGLRPELPQRGTRLKGAVAGLSLLLAACGTAGLHDGQLDEDALKTELVGHTVDLGTGFKEYYAPDGTLHGTDGERPYTGRWSIRDNRFCTETQAYGQGCFAVEKNRDGNWVWERATPVHSITAGNPNSL